MFLSFLLLFTISNEDFFRLVPDEEERMAMRSVDEKQLMRMLDHLGF